MKIDPSAPARSSAVRRAKVGQGKSSSKNFDSHLAEGVREAEGISAAAAPVAIDPLLAMQEVSDVAHDAERAKAQGEAILDRLDELRHGLLMGYLPKRKLLELTDLVRAERAKVQDQKLSDVLDQIELRAEVELAKLSAKI
jgi:hypothetical protein